MGLITKEFGVDRVYSHLHPTKAPELLSEHKKLTLKYYNKIIQNIDFEAGKEYYGRISMQHFPKEMWQYFL